MGKEYFRLEQISTVLANIKEYSDEEGPRFLYRSHRRFNENDGIIFVPDDEHLLFGVQRKLKKWKWPRLTSVKFLLRPRMEGGHRRYDAYYIVRV